MPFKTKEECIRDAAKHGYTGAGLESGAAPGAA
jgi:hypothetical protein